MTYEKLIEELKNMQTDLSELENVLLECYKAEDMNSDITQMIANETNKTHRHIAQLIFMLENGGKVVVKPVLEK